MWLFFYTKYFLSITEGLPCFLSSPATALFGSMLPASDTPRFSPSFPQSLNLPSNSPSHASCSQPPTLLSISFSAAKHVAHITTPWFLASTYLGWEKMYNMCCHISTQTPLLSFNAILRCLSSPDCQKNFRPRGRSCQQLKSQSLAIAAEIVGRIKPGTLDWEECWCFQNVKQVANIPYLPFKETTKMCHERGRFHKTKPTTNSQVWVGEWVFWTNWNVLFSLLQEKIENLRFLDTWGKKLFLSFYKGVGRCPAQTKNCFFSFFVEEGQSFASW